MSPKDLPVALPDLLADLEYDLTSNAVEFLRRAINGITDEADEQELTFAVVDLSVALEVLLKALLVRHDWTLICSDASDADAGRLRQGGVRTVTHKQAHARLVETVGLDLDGVRLAAFMTVRNRAVHFTLAGEDALALRAQLGRGLSLAMDLLRHHAHGVGDARAQDLVEEVIEEVADELNVIDELIVARLTSLEPTLAGIELCVECPRCGQPTLTLDATREPDCLFCVQAPMSPEELADAYVQSVLGLSDYEVITDGGEWPVHRCPWCVQTACVEGIVPERPSAEDFNDERTSPCDWVLPAHWGCFACGGSATHLEVERCNRCHCLVDGGSSVCTDCAADIFASNP